MFSSERAVKEFVQKDRNFAQKVLDHIKSIIADIKNIFNKLVASGNYDEISAWQSDEVMNNSRFIDKEEPLVPSTKRQSSVSEDASDYILDTKEYKEAMKLVDQRYRLTGKKKLDAKAIDRFAGRLLSKSQSQYSREQLTERLSALFDYIANSGTVIKKGLAHII